MSDAYLKNVVEAALLAAARPVSIPELLQIFEEQSRPSQKEMRAVLEQLAADYEGRGVAIKETATGFRFQVRTEFAIARASTRARCSKPSRSSPIASRSRVPRSRMYAASP